MQFGFLPLSLWDVLDILIVGYLLYRVYKLLKGSLAFSIFVGVLILYALRVVVQILGMSLLSEILRQVLGAGMIALLVVFQPEVRRFLLYLGRDFFTQRQGWLKFLLRDDTGTMSKEHEREVKEVLAALKQMSETKCGCLLIFAKRPNLPELNESGILLRADLTAALLESLFNKESPLHDGAVVISEGKVQRASVVLPISQIPNLPQHLGLRHRSAIGITETADVLAVVVSEESGKISYAREGRLYENITPDRLEIVLQSSYIT